MMMMIIIIIIIIDLLLLLLFSRSCLHGSTFPTLVSVQSLLFIEKGCLGKDFWLIFPTSGW